MGDAGAGRSADTQARFTMHPALAQAFLAAALIGFAFVLFAIVGDQIFADYAVAWGAFATLAASLLCLIAILVEARSIVGRWESGAVAFWALAPPCVVYGLFAGALMTWAQRLSMQPDGAASAIADALLMGACAALQGHLAFNVLRSPASFSSRRRADNLYLLHRDPIALSVRIQAMATCVAFLVAGVSIALDGYAGAGATEAAGVGVIGLIDAMVAVVFCLTMRRVMTGVPVTAAELRVLVGHIGAAAETTGAIRQVLDVEAVHMGPDAVRASVRLSFKEGVSASHVAAILDKLAAAVQVAQPNVSVVLAAGNSSRSDQKA